MKKISLLALFICIMAPYWANAQGKPNYVGQWYQRSAQGKSPQNADLFTPGPSDFTRTKRYNLRANANQLNSILRTAPALLNLVVPYGGRTYTLNLARVEITSGEMTVRTSQGNANVDKGVQYRGIVDGNEAHIASLNLTPGNVSGYFSTEEGNFVITREGLEFIVYNDQVLKAEGVILCATPEATGIQIPTQGALVTGIGCKTVNVYFECDYTFYQHQGSNVSTLINYLLGFFNQVATLYANENVAIQISDIFVWTTPDPYMGQTSTGNVLNAFRTIRGTNFNGHLAHFLTTRPLGGGVAYVNTLCNKAYAYGVSQVYSVYNNFPSYSWTVEVVAHELGHNLGSPHTHSCTWAGGALDNCYTPEGSCAPGPAPVGGGTVMSYCHLSSTGINFNYGFGYDPGNRIRSTVLNASCISSGASTAPAGLTTSNISSSGATLSWSGVSGATNYTVQYRLASSTSWSSAGSTAATSMTLAGLTPNSGYVWNVKSDCSNYSPDASFTTSGTATGCSAPAQLYSSSISQTTANVSWNSIPQAVSYTVQYRPSTSSTWSTVTVGNPGVALSSLTGGLTYIWQVKADCSPYSAQAAFTTLPVTTSGCSKPSNMTASNISSHSAVLTWTGAANAQNYSVRIRQSNAKKWTNFNNIPVNSFNASKLQPGKTYEWIVETRCTDGSVSGYTTPSTFSTQ